MRPSFLLPFQFFLTNNSNYSNYSDNSNSVVNTTKVKLTFINLAKLQCVAPHIARKSEEKVNRTCTGAKKAVILQPQSGNGGAQQWKPGREDGCEKDWEQWHDATRQAALIRKDQRMQETREHGATRGFPSKDSILENKRTARETNKIRRYI